MKLAYQSRWLRLLIEFFPAQPEIRRYRISPAGLEGRTGRLLRKKVTEQMQRVDTNATL